MTRDEIISAGVTPTIANAMADYLKTNLPMNPRIADPTSIINNEGVMTGWFKAADFIKLLSDKVNPVVPLTAMYSEPQPR
jgi:hypothetical protein